MRIYPEGSTKAVTDYIREKAREGVTVIDSDPEVGKAIEVPIEVYSRFNPVAPEHEPQGMDDWIRKEL